MKLRTLAPLAVSVVLGLSACARQAPPAPPAGPPEVGVITVGSQDVALSTQLPGRTSPYLVAEVRPQVSGILTKRLFEEGAQVSAGQPLYQIEPAPYRAALAQADAALEAARLLSERYDQLLKDRAVSQQERDDARANYLQARAAAESARINVGFTRITAPISGRIGRSSATQGALMTANQPEPISTIQQLDPIYVDITQPSTSLLKLKDDLRSGRLKGDGADQAQVRLKLEDGRDYAHAGQLKFSEVSVDPGTGAVTLRAVFPNPDGTLLPGMFVQAELTEGVRSNGILVPQRGITRDPSGKATALVVDATGKVQPRSVQVERALGSQWLVSDGLKPGDRLVVEGMQKVKPGMPVKAVDAKARPDQPPRAASAS